MTQDEILKLAAAWIVHFNDRSKHVYFKENDAKYFSHLADYKYDALYLANSDQSARIKTLEDMLKAKHYYNGGIGMEQLKKIDELTATNAKLVEQVRVMREAFESIASEIGFEHHDNYNLITKTLAITKEGE